MKCTILFPSLLFVTPEFRNIDQVDRTMDEIREQMDIANEINDAISQPLGDPIDEVRVFCRIACIGLTRLTG